VADVEFPPQLLVGLTPEQREAVTSPARRLVVRATAGSGKTHVLTLRILRRVAAGELEPEAVLAMTFTRKAGEELRKRLYRYGVTHLRAQTFHGAALDLVQRYRRDHGLKPLLIESSRIKLVRVLVGQMREDGSLKIDDWEINGVEREIGWALSQGLSGPDYAQYARRVRHNGPLAPAVFADVLDRYVGLCRSRGVVDFDLLLAEAIALLRNDDAVRAGFRHTTRALFVDETQDMNPLQFTLLKLMAGDDPDLFCVGDPNQSIYGFNGASPSIMNEIATTWPGVVELDLTRNHRSTASIVTVATTLIESGAAGLEPARDGGEIPLVRAYDTDTEEAEAVVTWLKARHHPGVPWRAMAVLARTTAQLRFLEAFLERADVPYELRGNEHGPGLGDSDEEPVEDEVRDAVALSTIHRAKGLEFAHVAAIGWAEGQLPHYAATSPAQQAEEQRLAYVALSRAENTLLVTWSRNRDNHKFPDRTPSRFLGPVAAAVTELKAQNQPLEGDERKARLAAIRAALTQGSN
jgi:DNA helicase-2/ATP-dependent DNA helicase PcrA